MTDTSRRAAADRAYEELLARIVGGRLAPGSRIVERDIAERLGMSRTPVREAIRRLQAEGLLIANAASRYSRPVVAPLTAEDAGELHDIVGRLEGGAARRAAALEPAVRESLAVELEKCNRAFREAAQDPRSGVGAIVDLDHEFHAVYVNAVAGPRLTAMRQAVKPQLSRYARSYLADLIARVPESVAEHDRIIEAIRLGDPDAAEAAVVRNWDRAAKRLHDAIETSGERGGW
jgi:DNA-binding GntR family transcriptional regulator